MLIFISRLKKLNLKKLKLKKTNCRFQSRFAEKLQEIMNGQRKITMILDDPAGNSYVQALTDDGSLDDRLKIERYDRSFDQNEELGLNDIKTENYS